MRWFHPIVWPILVAVGSFLVARAQSGEYSRVTNFDTYSDVTGLLDVDEVATKAFISHEKKKIAGAKAVWLKIEIPDIVRSWNNEAVFFTGSNETALSMHGYLLGNSAIDDLGVCDVQLNSTECKIASLQYAFPVRASTDDDKKYLLLRLELGPGAVSSEFYFMRKTYFNKVTIFLDQFVGLGIGVFLLVVVMSFIFYSAFKESSFLVYGLFYLALLLSLMINRGNWDAFRPDDFTVDGAAVLLPVLLSTVFFDLLFIKVFFDMRQRNKRLNLFVLAILAVILGAIVLSLFGFTRSYAWMMLSPIVMISMFVAAGILIYFVWQRRKWSESVATAWGIVIVCNLIWIFYRDGRISGFWFFGYYAIFGRVIESIVLNTVLFQRLQELNVRVGFAQAKAEEGVVVKALLRTLSHDLSNTTMVIRTSAQLAHGAANPEALLRNIDRVFSAAQSQAEIIENAKKNYLVRGGQIINLAAVDLCGCVRDATDRFKDRAAQKQVGLVVSLPEEKLVVQAEKTSLNHQVIANLLSNAVKFTKSGGTVAISARTIDLNWIELKVADSGIGIPAHILDRLFNEHESVSRPGTDGEVGSGDGMLIVRDFVSTYGAKFSIDSRVGSGTEVTVLFKKFSN
jgi:signal transduction histidine kinase